MAKSSSWPVTGLGKREPLKDLKDSKLILNESKLFPWLSRISLVPFRTFRNQRALIPQTNNRSGTFFFAVSIWICLLWRLLASRKKYWCCSLASFSWNNLSLLYWSLRKICSCYQSVLQSDYHSQCSVVRGF